MAQTAQKQTAEYAQAKLDALIASGGRYGVPVIVLRPDDAGLPPKLQPRRYQVHGRTGRALKAPLDKHESTFLENSLDIVLPHNKAPANERGQLYDWVEGCWTKVIAMGGAYAVTLPKPTKTADQVGPDAYEEKQCSVVLLSHTQTGKRDWLNFLLRTADMVDADATPGTGAHWSCWVLEHEMAHSSGAGEAQADMMAAANYVQTFDDPALPRTIADIRAINAVLRHASDDYSQTYGWAPVMAADELLQKGPAKIKAMQARDIQALRFKSFPDRRNDVDDFAAALSRINLSYRPGSDAAALIAAGEAALKGDKLKNKPGAQEIGRRFITALRRLSNTPAPQPTRRKQPGPN